MVKLALAQAHTVLTVSGLLGAIHCGAPRAA
jgi:hypothetical protein